MENFLGDSKIGGVGCIVEIDESLFVRCKNNDGRILAQQWVFDVICRETNEYVYSIGKKIHY